MVQAGVRESIADVIVQLGCDEEGLFRAAFVDQQAFEGWLNKLRHWLWSLPVPLRGGQLS